MPQPLVVPPPFEVPPLDDEPVPEEHVILPDDFLVAEALQAEDQGEIVARRDIAPPHAPAKSGAYILHWDRYHTLVVIDHIGGLVKSCWVVTLSTLPELIRTEGGIITLARNQVVVAYRAQAYYSKDGTLHIDARRASLSGVLANSWSPDSFAISPTKEVTAQDDSPSHPSNSGQVKKEVSAETQFPEFQRLLLIAMGIVQEMI